MLVVAFLQWWYGPGWRDAAEQLSARLSGIYLNFSVPILLRTMFAPWRRIISPPGSSLEQKIRTLIDNMVSRGVGFVVRLMALIAACLMMGAFALVGGVVVALWPVWPILGPILVVVGLV